MIDRHPWLLPLVEKDKFDRKWLHDLLQGLPKVKKVIRLMDHQAEAKPYFKYRKLFITPRVIAKGRAMKKKHARLIKRVEARFGAPGEVFVALWGIESRFGKRQGAHRVLPALFTLAASYTRRAEFFRGEFRAFLLLCREEGWDPTAMKGSYAGAMAQVQMIPSTMRRYAIDFDGNGKRDVFHQVDDALASIANFLVGHGWEKDGLYTFPVPTRSDLAKKVTTPTLAHMRPWREWRAEGFEPPPGAREPRDDEPAGLIKLAEEHGTRYHMVFNNFRVITRWNRSRRFAMVVHELSQALGGKSR